MPSPAFRYLRECTSGTWVSSVVPPIMAYLTWEPTPKLRGPGEVVQPELNRHQTSAALARGWPDETAVLQRRARTGGFSLIELLVVMAVMLVVAAFAIPSLMTTM